MCAILLVLAGAAPLTLITTSCLSRLHMRQKEIYGGRRVVRHGRTCKVEMKEGKSCLRFFVFFLTEAAARGNDWLCPLCLACRLQVLFIYCNSISLVLRLEELVHHASRPSNWPPLKAEQRVFFLFFFCCVCVCVCVINCYDLILEFLLTSAITLDY